MENSPTIRLQFSRLRVFSSAAPVYGDPLAGEAAFKCRFLTPTMHSEAVEGLTRG
jgi:hypothetical protein